MLVSVLPLADETFTGYDTTKRATISAVCLRLFRRSHLVMQISPLPCIWFGLTSLMKTVGLYRSMITFTVIWAWGLASVSIRLPAEFWRAGIAERFSPSWPQGIRSFTPKLGPIGVIMRKECSYGLLLLPSTHTIPMKKARKVGHWVTKLRLLISVS